MAILNAINPEKPPSKQTDSSTIGTSARAPQIAHPDQILSRIQKWTPIFWTTI
jgi:hypothetical protein